MTMILDEEGITISDKHSEGKTKWSGFVNWRVFPEGLLLYPQKDLFFWIPKEAEIEGGTWEEFVALVERKMGESC